MDDIAPEYEHIRTFLENLAGSYAEFQLVKQIPSAVWGDTLKPRASDGALVPVIDMSQLYLLHFSDYIPVEEVIEEFLKLSEIEYAHPPVEAVDLADPPNDPLYEGQWNLARIAAEDAWRITHGADNIRVAIIESNELPIRDHPDLINKWHPTIGEQGPGSGDHGTRVAGIIGAETNNEIGIASLARGLKMTRYFFLFPDLGLPNAINRAADSNRVINCSFLTVELHRIPGTDCTIRRPRSYASVHDAIRNSIRRERIIVGGAGNSKAWLIYRGTCTNEDLSDWFPHAAYPASYDSAIAVSATGASDLWAEGQNLNDPMQYYNYGSFVAVAAPGMNVLTTSGSNGYNDGERGTSFSAPHLSALAGLILSIDSTLAPLAVKDIITSTADKVDSVRFPYTNGWNSRLGHGRINAYRALSKANGSPAPPQNVQVTATPPNQYGYRYPKVTWSANSEPDLEGYEIWRKIVAGMDCGNGIWYLLSGAIGPSTLEYTDFSIPTAGAGQCTAIYRLCSKDAANLFSDYSNEVSVQFGNDMWKAGSEDSSVTLPNQFSLGQNFPNPFNPTTVIKYQLPTASHVILKLYDILGREVSVLVDAMKDAGYYEVSFDASRLASGMYLYSLKAGDFTSVRKLVLLR